MKTIQKFLGPSLIWRILTALILLMILRELIAIRHNSQQTVYFLPQVRVSTLLGINDSSRCLYYSQTITARP